MRRESKREHSQTCSCLNRSHRIGVGGLAVAVPSSGAQGPASRAPPTHVSNGPPQSLQSPEKTMKAAGAKGWCYPMRETLGRFTARKAIRTATILSGLGIVAATGLASAGPASAGSNGQQVSFTDLLSSQYQICGRNQNGTHLCTPWFPGAYPALNELAGYWWKGQIWIYGRNRSAQITCYVPTNLAGDWYFCGTL
jgi:hypothetical protein